MPLLTESSSSSSSSSKPSKQRPKQPSSWYQIKNILTCKQIQGSTVHDPSKRLIPAVGYTKLGSSCSSLCSFKDVVHGNTRVVHRADNSPEGSAVGSDTSLLRRRKPPSHGGLRKLSGCYECRTVVDPRKYPYSPGTNLCSCPQCGELFPKMESLELHQRVRHAVSELEPEDSGRNIVEIIFKSSWLNNDGPMCQIERILKVHNTHRTIQRFEDCRDAVKSHALAGGRKNPRCAADGNELLRFHCTTLSCPLGARGSSALCGASAPGCCGVCTVLRRGFHADHGEGVRTTARSGAAHDAVACTDGRRAMLVCRVIAGRVRRVEEDGACGAYDSVAGKTGIYANLEELMVYNPKAILPCFVVVYRALES